MLYKEFFAGLETLRRCYLISGEEAYLRDKAVEALRERAVTALPELNETLLESPDFPTLMDACETLPMLSERRLVLARGFPLLGKNRVADEAAQAEALANWLPAMPETTCLVLLQQEMDGRKKAAQTVKKHAVWLECKPMEDRALAQWINKEFSRRGKRTDSAELLLFRAGGGMYALEGHIARLCEYAGERETVTREDVERLVEANLEYSVFQYTDALFDRRDADAQGIMQVLLNAGESRIGLLAMLTGQLRQVFYASALLAEGRAPEDFLPARGYALTMLKKRAARVKPGAAREAYRACVDADYNIKSGVWPEEEGFFRVLRALPGLLKG